MTDTERRAATKQFAADWAGRGNEKQETQANDRAVMQAYGFDIKTTTEDSASRN